MSLLLALGLAILEFSASPSFAAKFEISDPAWRSLTAEQQQRLQRELRDEGFLAADETIEYTGKEPTEPIETNDGGRDWFCYLKIQVCERKKVRKPSIPRPCACS